MAESRFPLMNTVGRFVKIAGQAAIVGGGLFFIIGLGMLVFAGGMGKVIGLVLLALGFLLALGGVVVLYQAEQGSVLLSIEDNGYKLLNLQEADYQARLKDGPSSGGGEVPGNF